MSDNLVDPLLVLLQRHEAANNAYDAESPNQFKSPRSQRLGAGWPAVASCLTAVMLAPSDP
jgi:hypothetical protein